MRLGREVLGIEVHFVVEIRQNEPVTRVPRVPSWVVGVTNLRGRILSVVDLRSFLGLPADPAHKDTSSGDTAQTGFLVEVESPDMELVFLVNEVLGVEALPASSIQTESGLIHALPPEYLRGVMKQENGRWMTANGDNEKGKGRVSKNGKKNGERQPIDEKQAGGRRAGVTVTILNLNALLSDPRLLINDYAGEDDIR
jgi:purine-binding chemotaxis protein CheW